MNPSNPETTMKSGLLLCPVEDLDSAATFYRDTLGLPLRFRDGARYCAFDAGGYTLGLAAAGERVADCAAPVFRAEELAGAVASMLRAGASLVQAPQRGPHEWRAVLRAPGGGLLVLAAPL
jgi:predicted enzyme related to lactoylglutathione lyase